MDWKSGFDAIVYIYIYVDILVNVIVNRKALSTMCYFVHYFHFNLDDLTDLLVLIYLQKPLSPM